MHIVGKRKTLILGSIPTENLPQKKLDAPKQERRVLERKRTEIPKSPLPNINTFNRKNWGRCAVRMEHNNRVDALWPKILLLLLLLLLLLNSYLNTVALQLMLLFKGPFINCYVTIIKYKRKKIIYIQYLHQWNLHY